MTKKKPEQRDVTSIILSVSDDKRYPEISDILSDLVKAKGLSVKELAGKLGGISASRVNFLRNHANESTDNLKRFCTALGLSERSTNAIVAEKNRREMVNVTLTNIDGDEFALIVKAALDFYGKTVDDLTKKVPLNKYQKHSIRAGGIDFEHIDNWDNFIDSNRLLFSNAFKQRVIDYFREMTGDKDYSLQQMIQDAKGSFSLKDYARKINREPGGRQ